MLTLVKSSGGTKKQVESEELITNLVQRLAAHVHKFGLRGLTNRELLMSAKGLTSVDVPTFLLEEKLLRANWLHQVVSTV